MPNLIKVGLFHQLPISLRIYLYNIMPQLLVTGPEDSKFNFYSKNLNSENCVDIFDLGATGSTVEGILRADALANRHVTSWVSKSSAKYPVFGTIANLTNIKIMFSSFGLEVLFISKPVTQQIKFLFSSGKKPSVTAVLCQMRQFLASQFEKK